MSDLSTNNDLERKGRVTFLAAFNLAALPPEVYTQTIKALDAGATMSTLHDAASAIAHEAPVTCLEGVIATLLLLANPDVDLSPSGMSTGVNAEQGAG